MTGKGEAGEERKCKRSGRGLKRSRLACDHPLHRRRPPTRAMPTPPPSPRPVPSPLTPTPTPAPAPPRKRKPQAPPVPLLRPLPRQPVGGRDKRRRGRHLPRGAWLVQQAPAAVHSARARRGGAVGVQAARAQAGGADLEGWAY